jgi:hypothetical protein
VIRITIIIIKFLFINMPSQQPNYIIIIIIVIIIIKTKIRSTDA